MVNLAPGETIDVEYEAVNTGDVDSTQTLELTTQNGSTTVVDSVSQTFTVGQTGTGTLSWPVPSGREEETGLQLCVESENSIECIDLNIVSIPQDIVDNIYITDNSGTVHSVNNQTGNSNWVNNSFNETIYAQAHLDNSVYINEDSFSIYSLNSSDGSIDWSYETGLFTRGDISVIDGTVYATKSQDLLALDSNTGELEYQTTIANNSSFTQIIPTKDSIYTVETKVDSLNRTNGDTEWEVSLDGALRDSYPIIEGGKIYVAASNGVLNVCDTELEYIESITQITTSTNSDNRGISVDSDSVYIPVQEGELYSIDKQTQSENWVINSFNSLNSNTLVNNGNIYVVDGGDGLLYSIDIETQDTNWTYNGDFDSLHRIVGKRGLIYVDQYTSNEYKALDPSDGTEVWTYNVNGLPRSCPIGGSDAKNESNRRGAVGNTVFLPQF